MVNELDLDAVVATAKQHFSAGKFKPAIAGFETAFNAYAQAGDPLLAAEMANNLSVALLQDKQHKKALQVVLGTDKTFESHGDSRRQAIAIANIGSAHQALKQFDQAAAAFQQAADLFQQCGEPEMRSTVLKSLSALQVRQGKQLESLFAMQRSLDSKEKPSLKDKILRFLLEIPFKFLGK